MDSNQVGIDDLYSDLYVVLVADETGMLTVDDTLCDKPITRSLHKM